jgi:hypothetical protein
MGLSEFGGDGGSAEAGRAGVRARPAVAAGAAAGTRMATRDFDDDFE